jgi:WD40 repeat protein
LAYAPSGQYLVTGGEDGEVRLWSAPDLELEATFYGEDIYSVPTAIEFSPGGGLLAYGTDGGFIVVRQLAGPQKWTLASDGIVQRVVFRPDGQGLAALSTDNQIRIWRSPNWELEHTLNSGPGAPVPGADSAASFSPDGRLLLWGNSFWDARDGSLLHSFFIGGGHVYSSGAGIMEFSSDGRYAAVPSYAEPPGIVILDTSDFSRVASVHPQGGISSYAFANDGEHLFSTAWPDWSDPRQILSWNIATGRVVDSALLDLVAMVALPDGNSLAAIETNYDYTDGFSTTALSQFALPSFMRRWSHQIYDEHAFAVSPSGDSIALIEGDSLLLLDSTDGRILWSVPEVSADVDGDAGLVFARVDTPAFSPDGSLIATSGSQIKLWRVADGTLVKVLEGTSGTIGPASFSPDGRLLGIAHEGVLMLYGIDVPKAAGEGQ